MNRKCSTYEREKEREEILAFNKWLLMQGIHVGMKDVPDPIEDESPAVIERGPEIEDLELEDFITEGDNLCERDKPFGWPRANEMVDTDFIPPRGDKYCLSVGESKL